MPKPNLFVLYENEIGLLTPMVADMLGEAIETYPEAWFAPAIKIAVERNVRNWKYVEAILKGWKVNGFQSKNGKRVKSDRILTLEEEHELSAEKYKADAKKYGYEY